MAKIHFRPYNPNQTVLFPPRIDEDIAENDPVRMVNALVESLNLESFRKLYKECGRSPYHPRMMLCNILVNSLRKKHCLVGIIRTKMYLCHSENLMPKDTKSLGNNKAPACESRGFVLKKKKVRILTHLLYDKGKLQ